MFLHGKMNSRTHPLGPSLEAIGGGSDPLPATQRSAFTMRPNPSLAPPPTTTAPESTALPLCAAVGHERILARTPSARCAQWRVPQIRAGRPTMRRAAVQHAVQAARRCGRAFRAYTCEPLAAGSRIIKYTLRRMTANGEQAIPKRHGARVCAPHKARTFPPSCARTVNTHIRA